MRTFRTVTNTEDVDLKSLTYERWCKPYSQSNQSLELSLSLASQTLTFTGTRDGVMQATAREIDALGYDARSEDPFLPNAAILRSAEAVDAVLNAARSGTEAESPTASAGLILCSITQLGGVLYVLFVLVIALVLLSFLPVVNFAFQLCFDATTAGLAVASGRPALATSQANGRGQTAFTRRFAAGATALQGRVQRRAQRQRQARTGATAGDGDSEHGRLLPEPTTEVRTAPRASVHHAEAVRVHVEHPKGF